MTIVQTQPAKVRCEQAHQQLGSDSTDRAPLDTQEAD
jgi:hypothetical protein